MRLTVEFSISKEKLDGMDLIYKSIHIIYLLLMIKSII